MERGALDPAARNRKPLPKPSDFAGQWLAPQVIAALSPLRQEVAG